MARTLTKTKDPKHPHPHSDAKSPIKSGSTVASDYFHSLNRVAELVPDVSFKAVVYGGVTRQSRSDCEVVPLADLGGVLQRFEVDQEIAVFVRDRKSPEQDNSDVKTLDTVYHTHIRPILEYLESTFQPVADKLFRGFRNTFTITWCTRDVSIDGWLQTGTWEKVKQDYLLEEGFDLSGPWRFELRYDYEFKYYTGEGGKGFAVLIRIVWEFRGEGFTRRVMVGGEWISELDRRIHYSELDTRSAEVDGVVAEISESLLRQIDVLSSR